ncbi:MAG TPA: glycosyltransferase family 4 protein [Vicinamibacterales bacterium]|jgi:glycosyltransferase involved in cell wall biosynthesis
MTRVAVVTSSPPMIEGGHMVIARELTKALCAEGYDAHVLVTPQNRFGRQASAYLATWLTDVQSSDGRPIDQVISLRYPSYAVRHPRHVCWLNHTMREYYDLWDRFSATLTPQGRVKERIRRTFIHAADRYLLTRNVTRLVTQSNTIRERLSMWPDLRASVVYPPAPDRPYRCEEYGDDILFVSRLTPLKRADLLIRALATTDGRGLRIVVAGDGEAGPTLETLAREIGVDGRVRFAGRVSESEMIDLLSRCRAVCFPPFEEDYGFVTVEAFASRKAVVTCRDSGGPAELVVDGKSGFVSDPTPQAVARALRTLAEDKALAERMGGDALAAGARLTWPETVRQLIL